jgi:hypothetical protein
MGFIGADAGIHFGDLKHGRVRRDHPEADQGMLPR